MQPAAKTFAFADGQRVAHAVHETVRNIEIRSTLLPFRMAPISDISASMETQRRRRNFVDGLAKSVRRQEAQIIGEALLDLGLQGMVMRAITGAPQTEIAEIRPQAPAGDVGIGVCRWRHGVGVAKLIQSGP